MNNELKTYHSKTIAVIDGGGRGAVLVDKYLKSKYVKKVIAIPGNDLMLRAKNVRIFPQLKTTDIDHIIDICKKQKVDLVDVAQDDAVAIGVADKLKKIGFKVFGPTKLAGQIEWDKAWARNFMQKFNIPHPPFKICKSQKQGITFINSQKGGTWYIKASGLAAGKGALFAQNNSEALQKISEMKNFGTSGKTYLIEKYVEGEEFSSFAIVNGKNFKIVGHAQDHKKLLDGDIGPNTGGMGCSSPPLIITPKIEKKISIIFKKTVEGLSKLSRPYLGVLYLGGIINKKGEVYVIEFNARWGDPEAQVILPAIKNDLFELITNALNNQIPKIKKDNFYRVAVTAASKGYPIDHSKVMGKEINGLKNLLKSKAKIYGAGVKNQNGKYVAAGGRLFYVLGEGKNVAIARKKAYDALSSLSADSKNIHFRKDIGYRDLIRLSNDL